MLDHRTDRTDPSKLPSRTGLAFILFIVVIAVAGAVFYGVFRKAHPDKTGGLRSSIVELEHRFHQLLIDIDKRVL